jgi:hypothetical protein
MLVILILACGTTTEVVEVDTDVEADTDVETDTDTMEVPLQSLDLTYCLADSLSDDEKEDIEIAWAGWRTVLANLNATAVACDVAPDIRFERDVDAPDFWTYTVGEPTLVVLGGSDLWDGFNAINGGQCEGYPCLASLTAHEIGHILGLEDCEDAIAACEQSIMAPSFGPCTLDLPTAFDAENVAALHAE